jgi:gamma-glutamyltranspeptidase/glutathione hydrolase
LSTVSPLATEVGERIFAQGGNAADVAVAVGFALAVTYPPAGNIGGGGFALVRNGMSGEITSLDFRETAPAAATETMFLDSVGEVISEASTRGARAAGTPGTVAGLHTLWTKYGSLPWADLLAPAITLADSGFVIDSALADELAENSAELQKYPQTASLFIRYGKPLGRGDTLIQGDLARSLRLIASAGPSAFYQGEIATQIVECMQQQGGLITAEDLATYAPVWRVPFRFTFDSLEIVTMAPPSSGGIVMGEILKILEPSDFSRWSPYSAEYIHLFCEAARLAFADRATHLGDPAYYSIPAGLLDSAYLAERRSLIKPDRANISEEINAGEPSAHESSNTTHISVADAKGNVVSLTYTLNDSFGSSLMAGRAGFLLNNEMDDFSIKPGVANIYGLVGGEANKIAPGKRMLSSMSPTIVQKQGRPVLVLGSPGGSKIITAVAQAIIDYSRFGLSPAEIVRVDRFHHQWKPDVITLEAKSQEFSDETKRSLEQIGHTLAEKSPSTDIHLIEIGPSGMMCPVADWRRGGRAGGY